MEAETNCLDSAMSFTENEAVGTIEQGAVGTIEQEELCPLGDRIMVQVVVPKEVITNGIYHPENTIERPLEGLVIATGDGARNDQGIRIPMDVKAGDRICFGKYAGNEVEPNGVKLLLLSENEVMGVYRKKRS